MLDKLTTIEWLIQSKHLPLRHDQQRHNPHLQRGKPVANVIGIYDTRQEAERAAIGTNYRVTESKGPRKVFFVEELVYENDLSTQDVYKKLDDWRNLGVNPEVVRHGDDGPVLRLYHGTPNLDSVYSTGFDPGAKSRFATYVEPYIYFSERREYAELYGDVVEVEVPARYVELYQTNPMRAGEGAGAAGAELIVSRDYADKIAIIR